jgi:hypothetical protein
MVGTRSRVRRYIPRRSFLVPLRTRTRAIGAEALRFSNAGSRGRKNKSHRRPQRSQSIGEELAATRRLQTESLMGAQNGIHAGRYAPLRSTKTTLRTSTSSGSSVRKRCPHARRDGHRSIGFQPVSGTPSGEVKRQKGEVESRVCGISTWEQKNLPQ